MGASMKNKHKRGVILGVTAISLLIVFLVASLVFTYVLNENGKYTSYNKDTTERIKVKTITQEVYVDLYEDIVNGVEITAKEFSVETALVTITVNEIETQYGINVNYHNLTSMMLIGMKGEMKGEILAWTLS